MNSPGRSHCAILPCVKLFPRKELPAMQAYATEYIEAFARTESLGLNAPPRILVLNDCVDPDRTLAVILDYYERATPEQLLGQTLAINTDLVDLLWDATRVAFELTFGYVELGGKRYGECSEETLRRYVTERYVAWQREGVPFHIWLTSPACEVLDVTFAMNLGGSRTREECARRIVYKSSRSQGDPIYHPMLVGADFLRQTGALVDLGGVGP